MIIMISFGFIYTQFVNVFYGLYKSLLIGMTGSLEPVVPQYKNLGLNVFGAFLYLMIAIQLALLYFQFLTRGFEMLILRLRNSVCLYRFIKCKSAEHLKVIYKNL